MLGDAVYRLAPTFAHLPLGFPTNRLLTANMVWLTVMLSYSLFLGFIRTQAAEAIRIQNELDLAHGIQQTLVPLIHSTGPLYEVYGLTRPSERVGGDLVDLIPSRDGDIAYVADVAGHGLQAGILMGMLKAAARTALLEPSTAPSAPALAAGPAGQRAALRSRRATCTQPLPRSSLAPKAEFAMLSQDTRPSFITAMRTALLRTQPGTVSAWPGAGRAFRAMEINVEPGDLLLIATDGILETCNRGGSGVRHGRSARLRRIQRHAPSPQLAANVLAAVAKWGKQQDDQTLLIVRCISNT